MVNDQQKQYKVHPHYSPRLKKRLILSAKAPQVHNMVSYSFSQSAAAGTEALK